MCACLLLMCDHISLPHFTYYNKSTCICFVAPLATFHCRDCPGRFPTHWIWSWPKPSHLWWKLHWEGRNYYYCCYYHIIIIITSSTPTTTITVLINGIIIIQAPVMLTLFEGMISTAYFHAMMPKRDTSERRYIYATHLCDQYYTRYYFVKSSEGKPLTLHKKHSSFLRNSIQYKELKQHSQSSVARVWEASFSTAFSQELTSCLMKSFPSDLVLPCMDGLNRKYCSHIPHIPETCLSYFS